jgi:hypothetical protein
MNINKTIANTFSELQLTEFHGAVYHPEVRSEKSRQLNGWRDNCD